MTVHCLVCARPIPDGRHRRPTADVLAQPAPLRRLTPTEEQLFATLHNAPSNEEVAAHLHVTPRTVKFHIANIRSKLGGMTRLRLCLLSALHHRGLLSLCDACMPLFANPPDGPPPGAAFPARAPVTALTGARRPHTRVD
ncbi:helix-turn-helix transcriptional regulator [Streptomyces sp. NBC_00876]|uniref:helix-turn-helix domain-containing protein n=1 Tax=Streptomyces sp. NBC_00876 TaxID=2975853 RepID=UPI003864134D